LVYTSLFLAGQNEKFEDDARLVFCDTIARMTRKNIEISGCSKGPAYLTAFHDGYDMDNEMDTSAAVAFFLIRLLLL
jgi:hypothetical protein